MVAVLAAGVGLAAASCASSAPRTHSLLADEEIDARLSGALRAGMTREEAGAALDDLGLSPKWRIWRDEPPGMLQRIWPPGGFWVREQFETIRYFDVRLAFGTDGLASWEARREYVTYRFGRPEGPGQDARRRFPLPPLPPEDFRGEFGRD